MDKIYYNALINKDPAFEGIFYVGVKTTGVFCRPTCRARKPNFANCEFFKSAKEAVLAFYRPCKICHPLSYSGNEHQVVAQFVQLIEENPEKRWRAADFRELDIDESTARRQFKKRFDMTFVEYARSRRMAIAFKQIKDGEKVIEVQLNMGYDSGSGFRDAFSKILGCPPMKSGDLKILHSELINTHLGTMIAIADDDHLYLLEFTDRRGLEKEIDMLRKKVKAAILPGGANKIIALLRVELADYFEGKLEQFTVPMTFLGSHFQQQVWGALQNIPYGTTLSYLEQAKNIANPKATRAVANANGANIMAIIVPCHRVIRENGELGGYGGGIERKKWLIQHENSHKKSSGI